MMRRLSFVLGLVLVAACGSDADRSTAPDTEADPGTPIVVDTEPGTTAAGAGATAAPPASAPADTTGDTTGTTAAPPASPPADTTADEAATTAVPALPEGPLPVPTVEPVEVARVESVTEVTARPGDDRLIVVTQQGTVYALGASSAETVLDVSDRTRGEGERGLLGLAFHPRRPLAYAHFTDLDGDTVVAEYAVDAASGVLDRDTQRIVFTADQPYSNHNGGELAFGPDGYLYLGLGDGGSADDPQRTALDLTSPLGKIHRFDPRPDGDGSLTVPDDNPFADGSVPTIWSYGLRNPWKFSFDPLTGDLWVADVGQASQEEVTRAVAAGGRGAARGLDFGWSAWEGTARFNTDQPAEGAVAPTLTYTHENGNCSVSGGAVARGEINGDLAGWYVFGDYCSGVLWGFDTTVAGSGTVVELARIANPTGVAAGPDGALYAFSQDGSVHRLTAA